MRHIGALQTVVTDDDFGREPTDLELGELAYEMPLILAEVEELDVQISLLDRTPTEMDQRRLRRARNKVLAARRNLTNQGGATSPEVA